jgi:general secretion pathway protein M
MKSWFDSLAARERLMVMLGAGVLALLLFYVMIWSPMFERNATLRRGIAEQQDTFDWMRESAGKIQSLRRAAGGNAATGLGGRSLLAVVDESARGSGLGDSIKRIEPDAAKGVKVWLENAGFDQIILWLGGLSRRYQVEISSITVDPLEAGRVNARISLLEAAV